MILSGKYLRTINANDFVNSLLKEFSSQSIEESQIVSWEETLAVFKAIVKSSSAFDHAEFLFEYSIPLSDGKRPDVLMFVRNRLYIIEFKNRATYTEEDIRQLEQYLHLIKFYHSESDRYELKSILLINSDDELALKQDNISIASRISFIKEWTNINQRNLMPQTGASVFECGDYKPNLDILEYAKSIFIDSHLNGIEHPILEQATRAFNKISRIIDSSKKDKLHSLVFVLGEAGSGKSAVALKLLKKCGGCYISKNARFIDLISNRIGHKVNIHTSTSIIRQYLERKKSVPDNVVIIDEAQRVWSEKRINEYYWKLKPEGDWNEISEYDIQLQHLNSKDWSTTVLFIGINQQLAKNETSYFDNWIRALKSVNVRSDNIRVYHPPELMLESNCFRQSKSKMLKLSNCIRNNIGHHFTKMVNDIIEKPESKDLQGIVKKCTSSGFKLLVSRDLKNCIEFVKNSEKERNISTALIGTHNSSDEESYGDKIDYMHANAVPIEKLLNRKNSLGLEFLEHNALTQFQALGLEFEIPIVQWSTNYLYYEQRWNYDFYQHIMGYGKFYVRNAYRVLMTRGRKGMILFFPDHWRFNDTYHYFKKIGFNDLTWS